MDQATKDRLKAIPRGRCNTCDTPVSYTNPMAKCSICKNKFC